MLAAIPSPLGLELGAVLLDDNFKMTASLGSRRCDFLVQSVADALHVAASLLGRCCDLFAQTLSKAVNVPTGFRDFSAQSRNRLSEFQFVGFRPLQPIEAPAGRAFRPVEPPFHSAFEFGNGHGPSTPTRLPRWGPRPAPTTNHSIVISAKTVPRSDGSKGADSGRSRSSAPRTCADSAIRERETDV